MTGYVQQAAPPDLLAVEQAINKHDLDSTYMRYRNSGVSSHLTRAAFMHKKSNRLRLTGILLTLAAAPVLAGGGVGLGIAIGDSLITCDGDVCKDNGADAAFYTIMISGFIGAAACVGVGISVRLSVL